MLFIIVGVSASPVTTYYTWVCSILLYNYKIGYLYFKFSIKSGSPDDPSTEVFVPLQNFRPTNKFSLDIDYSDKDGNLSAAFVFSYYMGYGSIS